jgi:hypothetical protein
MWLYIGHLTAFMPYMLVDTLGIKRSAAGI